MPAAAVTRFRGCAAAAVALAALALALWPVLATPLVSDDVINYSFRWLGDADYSRAVLEEIRYWILSSGRIFAFSTYLKNAVFQVFETAPAYKAFLVAANLACAAVFYVYARILSGSRTVPVAALLALTVLLQLRDYHDPVVSFNGLFQVCAALVFAALAFQALYARTGRPGWLYACLAAFVANLFVYEMAALTVPLLWMQERMLAAPGHARYRATKVAGLVLGAYLVAVVAARIVGATVFQMTGSAYGLGLNPGLVLATFAKQLLATVPFSYFALKPQDGNWGVHALPDPTPWLGSWHFFLALPALVLLSWAALRLASRADADANAGADGMRPAPAPRDTRALAWVAGGLLLLPAAMVAVVGRYQGAFGPGNGYSPVYLQQFGAALAIGLLLFSRPAGRRRGVAIAAFACVAGFAAAGNLVNNFALAARLGQAWAPQHAWGAMLRSADFRDTCGASAVAAMDSAPWAEYRVIEHAGFRVAKPGEVRFAAGAPPAAATAACVARSVRLFGRDATAYTRIGTPAAGATGEPVYIVLPLPEAEARTELPLGGECEPAPRRLPLKARWRHAGRDFGLFAIEPASGALRWHAGGFALPCEKVPGQ